MQTSGFKGGSSGGTPSPPKDATPPLARGGAGGPDPDEARPLTMYGLTLFGGETANETPQQRVTRILGTEWEVVE